MTSQSRTTAVQIALATFAILVLELAVIRWMSQQIRVFAYLNNLLLIAAFLGMGVGLGLASRYTRLIHWMLPLLAALSVLLAFARPLDLMDLSFPDISIALWGADGIRRGETFVSTLRDIIALFVLVAGVFACGGNVVGVLFGKLPPLRAYSADLLGSLLGVIAMAAISSLGTPPPVWFAVGCLAVMAVSRKVTDVVATIVIVVCAALSIQGAEFSPYNRLDLFTEHGAAGPNLVLAANRDFHQYLLDLSDTAIHDPRLTPEQQGARQSLRNTYDLPFLLASRRSTALVVGAGTGNDVAAALRNGFAHVTSVDIDPAIIRTGRRLHPEHPYRDPRTEPVVNDARNFFERNSARKYDVVCFGLLDSHAMFSAMSTLRLDNYVYTRDGLRAAWGLVAPGGVMSVTFQVWQGEWIASRIAAAMEAATGQPPLIFGGAARTFVVARGVDLRPRALAMPEFHRGPRDRHRVRMTTDDWPFLYLRPGVFPTGYVAVLTAVLLIALLSIRFAFGAGTLSRQHFDAAMFFMGAAFLLIETRGVTDLSLLFGSTWIVNSAVFAGVLLVAFVANALVARFEPRRIDLWFIPLLAALALSYAIRPSALLRFPYPLGGIIGGLVNALPVGFAAAVFSYLLKNSASPASALGANLLGAVAGGCLEYVSMLAGLRAVTLIAAALYCIVFIVVRNRTARSVVLQQ